jgi:NitT/TauT family transport system ATP-binding protein
VPTTYPKCNPTEMLGLLVLLNNHKGSEDVALLADDLDLEIDEIFPSLEYAEVLQLVKTTDGHTTLTELGRRLMAATIRGRKAIIRDQLKRTALFRTIVRALENAPGHELTDEELAQIISVTTPPTDETVQNLVNWGRYADLFRYDADEHRLILVRAPASPRSSSGRPPPPSDPTSLPGAPGARRPGPAAGDSRGTGVVPALA